MSADQPTVLPWHREAADAVDAGYIQAEEANAIPSLDSVAAIIAGHDESKRYAESLQQIAEAMGAPFESGTKIVQRVKEAQAQHAETLRLLELSLENNRQMADTYGLRDDIELCAEIRAHLAAQKGTP